MMCQEIADRGGSNSEIRTENYFVLKELFDENELRQHFRVRYQMYSYMGYIDPNMDKLDIDLWDLHSTFLGVFKKETNRLIGTLRVISNKDMENRRYDRIMKISCKLKESKLNIMLTHYDFPMMQAFNIENFIEGCYARDRKVVEASRLTILPQYRKKRLATILAEFAVGYAYENALDDCVIAVHPRHSPIYQSLGFTPLPDTDEIIYPGINNAAIAMHLDFRKVNEPHHSNALKMQQSVRKKGYFETQCH